MLNDAIAPAESGELAQDPDAKPVAPNAPKPGPFQMTDADLARQIRLWFKESADAKVEISKKRRQCHAMYANDQWEDDDRKKAKDQKRPALTLNHLLAIISAVEGEERTNRQEIKYYGNGQEDDGSADGMNKILKWIMHQCNGEFALSRGFRDTNIGGESWLVPDVDYFEDPEGKINLLWVDDEEIFDDPLSTCPVSSDSRYMHRVKMMTEEEIEARWPGGTERIRQAQSLDSNAPGETDGKGYRDIYLTPGDPKSTKIYDAAKKLWAVLETWWTQIEPGWVVINEQTGMLEEKSDEEVQQLKLQRRQEQLAAIQARVSAMSIARSQVPVSAEPGAGLAPIPMPMSEVPPPIQATQRPIKCLYQAYSVYDDILDKQQCPMRRLKRLPYVPIRALYDKNKREWFGLVWPLIDPQKQHNVEQSVIVQLMQLMPKQSWMGPKGSFHNKQEWGEKVAQPGAILEYNATRGKPEPITPPAIPRHLIDMAFSRPDAMRQISGVNTDMMGQRVANDPGVAMEQRKNAAKTVLAPIFDNYRMSKLAIGAVLLCYIQQYVSPGRRIRVLSPDQVQNGEVQMTEQMGLERFDLTVEETNSTINDRIATLNILQTTLPQMIKGGVPFPPEFVDLMPMPPHVRDEWKRLIMSWTMALNNQLPPPGWQPGLPVPPAGLPAPGAQPHVSPPPAATAPAPV
jgi:hypothetical protein